MVKVICVRGFTLKNIKYVKGDEYNILAKEAKDYSEYFERMTYVPNNKAKLTEENK